MSYLEGNKKDLCDYISEHPIISKEKERWEFAKPKELMNRELLVNSNLRIVWKLTDSIINSSDKLNGGDFMDLFNSGIIGLNKAIDKFDATYDVRFVTYAHYWIKVYITKERDKRLVKNSDADTLYLEDIQNELKEQEELPHITPYNPNLNIDTKNLIQAIYPLLTDEEQNIFNNYFLNCSSVTKIGQLTGLSERQTYYRINKIKTKIKEHISLNQFKSLIGES